MAPCLYTRRHRRGVIGRPGVRARGGMGGSVPGHVGVRRRPAPGRPPPSGSGTSASSGVAAVLGLPVRCCTRGRTRPPSCTPAMTTCRSSCCWAACSSWSRGGSWPRGTSRPARRSTPRSWGVGALLASLVGTTGASMLLIRPLLSTNQERRHVTHTVVFFIFIVSNVGGCLTPLGDPPLFLGVPAGRPLHLDPAGSSRAWLFVNAVLLAGLLPLGPTRPRPGGAGGPHPRPRRDPAPAGEGEAQRRAPAPDRGQRGLAGVTVAGSSPCSAGLRGLAGRHPPRGAGGQSLHVSRHRGGGGPLRRDLPDHVARAGHPARPGASLGLTAPWHFFWASGCSPRSWTTRPRT